MSKRKSLSKKVRFDVFKRDEFSCQYCGRTPPSVVLHVDHIHPVKLGGDNSTDNLITSCLECNLGKGATSLKSVPESLKDRAKDTAEKESQIAAYAKVMAAKRERIESQCWDVADIYMVAFDEESILHTHFESIKQFLHKIPLHDAMDAMDVAVNAIPYNKERCFRYFCGVCWNRIKGGKDG